MSPVLLSHTKEYVDVQLRLPKKTSANYYDADSDHTSTRSLVLGHAMEESTHIVPVKQKGLFDEIHRLFYKEWMLAYKLHQSFSLVETNFGQTHLIDNLLAELSIAGSDLDHRFVYTRTYPKNEHRDNELSIVSLVFVKGKRALAVNLGPDDQTLPNNVGLFQLNLEASLKKKITSMGADFISMVYVEKYNSKVSMETRQKFKENYTNLKKIIKYWNPTSFLDNLHVYTPKIIVHLDRITEANNEVNFHENFVNIEKININDLASSDHLTPMVQKISDGAAQIWPHKPQSSENFRCFLYTIFRYHAAVYLPENTKNHVLLVNEGNLGNGDTKYHLLSAEAINPTPENLAKVTEENFGYFNQFKRAYKSNIGEKGLYYSMLIATNRKVEKSIDMAVCSLTN